MKVYKFGGASVKDAQGIKNLLTVLKQTQETGLVVVVSAMGKTTNALEKVVKTYHSQASGLKEALQEVETYHYGIVEELFIPGHKIFSELKKIFTSLNHFLTINKSTNLDFIYDQIVSYGEMLSSTISYHYLTQNKYPVTFLDARDCIITNASYREAEVNWIATKKNISEIVKNNTIYITQGFIASEPEHRFTTTLGREGSDYTAAIFAYCLNAERVTIWKDVPGVLNADPRHFKAPVLLKHISYREAIELAFYGASVIHPKTIQPLQRKEIPLYVKSFQDFNGGGTCVGKGVALEPHVPCFILKKNQVLISLSSRDLSFMAENHIGDVFKLLHRYKMKVNVIQNSAISFTVCVDNKFSTLDKLILKLREQFKVKWNEDVVLYTIRHANHQQVKQLLKNKKMLLKLESRETLQLVVKELD